MDEQERLQEERRLRRLALTAATGQVPNPEDPEDPTEEEDSLGQRLEHRALWVDVQIRRAMERGDFDNLPGAGKPIPGLDGTQRHDPDWWVKGLIERERITGVLPPALGLRNEDAALDDLLDREVAEDDVRRAVADFNSRVVAARRQLLGGPPVITPTRDVDQQVAAWKARRAARRTPREEPAAAPRRERRTPRWRRRRTHD